MNADGLMTHRCRVYRSLKVTDGAGAWTDRGDHLVAGEQACRATQPRRPGRTGAGPAGGLRQDQTRTFYFPAGADVREGDVALLAGQPWRLAAPVDQPDAAYRAAWAILETAWVEPTGLG
jgi:hypothetical protein